MVIISGGSSFIGQNLLKTIPNSQDVSLRHQGWQDKFYKGNVIINLVGKAHDHKGTATKEDYYQANFELVKEMFDVFLKSPARLFIHMSSLAAVEEFESPKPLIETDACNPQSWYGKSKREAEQYLLKQDLPKNKKLIILRPPMVHGKGDKGNLGLLYKFISNGIPYPLSAFNNQRSFISVDNLSFFINQIIDKYHELSNGIYHVSDDEVVSTNRIILIIKQVTEKRLVDISLPQILIKGIAKIGDFIPLPLNSQRLRKMTSNLIVSNSKIKGALSIQKLPLTAEEGLRNTIKSFGENP